MKTELVDNHILHVSWEMGIGGAERSVYQLIREQRKLGFVVDLLVCSDSGGFYADKVRESGANVHILGQKTTYDLSQKRRTQRILEQYDIVHFHSSELGVAYLASHMPSVTKFYTHRSGAFTYPLKTKLRYKIVGYLYRKYFCAVSSITHHARRATAELFRIPMERIPVTYNAVDAESLAPKIPRPQILARIGENDDQTIRVGTSGMFRPCKRIDRLIEAFSPVATDNLKCYIVGDGPSLPELKEMTSTLNLAARVKFVGKTTHVGDYLQLMDVFVVPSGPEEAFGNSAVESMALGIPTIVFSDGGGLVEHIKDGVTGFVVKDVNELRERLQQLAINRELRRTIGEAGRRDACEKYGLKAYAERFNNFYRVGLKAQERGPLG